MWHSLSHPLTIDFFEDFETKTIGQATMLCTLSPSVNGIAVT